MQTKKASPFAARIRSCSTPMLLDMLALSGSGDSPGEVKVSGFVKSELSARMDWDKLTKEERDAIPTDTAGLADFYSRHLA